MPSNLDRVLGGFGTAGVGGLLASGLAELVEHFTKGGHGTKDGHGELQSPPASAGSLAASTPPGTQAGFSRVSVPGIETARIVRGDNLWTIGRRTYGEGVRHTLIDDADQDRIRDPDLIYPGQVLVLPSEAIPGAGRD